MSEVVANNHVDDRNSLFKSREQFLILSKRDDFNETLDYYKSWVNTYEKETEMLGYHAHTQAAQYLAMQQQPRDIRILDAACGTGLCGQVLQDQYGYKHMDGLDASEEMLKVARKRGIYERVYFARLGNRHRIPVADRKYVYDAVTMAGGLVSGHVTLDAFDELTRVTKPGGNIVISLRDEVRRTVPEYIDLDQKFADYASRGVWRKVSETITTNYYMGLDGVVFVFCVQEAPGGATGAATTPSFRQVT